ncbi:flagellar basal body-associated FliL family protein [Shewanella morhuae]|uniref:Flagellar protein FliL n=1 Tax=Shewanella morhuae TaxID=365591 RepID=A0A380B2G4_9GAMM|nr:flagellar basal body-associated FliL family protein [Shewanella morhuae]SUI91873.1 flagellar basal body-associated protein FliL [Shewanella morhuae]
MAIAKSQLVKIIVAVLVLISSTAGAFWVGNNSADWKLTEMFTSEPEVEPVPVAKYYPLEKFVISIPGDKYPHYMLLEMSLKSHNPNMQTVLVESDALLRNTMMKMFSRKTFTELNSLDQLDSLQAEALILMIKVLSDNQLPSDIDEVLFTRMVIQ